MAPGALRALLETLARLTLSTEELGPGARPPGPPEPHRAGQGPTQSLGSSGGSKAADRTHRDGFIQRSPAGRGASRAPRSLPLSRAPGLRPTQGPAPGTAPSAGAASVRGRTTSALGVAPEELCFDWTSGMLPAGRGWRPGVQGLRHLPTLRAGQGDGHTRQQPGSCLTVSGCGSGPRRDRVAAPPKALGAGGCGTNELHADSVPRAPRGRGSGHRESPGRTTHPRPGAPRSRGPSASSGPKRGVSLSRRHGGEGDADAGRRRSCLGAPLGESRVLRPGGWLPLRQGWARGDGEVSRHGGQGWRPRAAHTKAKQSCGRPASLASQLY